MGYQEDIRAYGDGSKERSYFSWSKSLSSDAPMATWNTTNGFGQTGTGIRTNPAFVLRIA